MYSYSYREDGPWLGEFEKAQDALTAGRAVYDGLIFVGKMERANFSDMFIGARALLSYMQEDAADKHGDDFSGPFEALPNAVVSKLDMFLTDAIGEWETELPKECEFSGQVVKQQFRYRPDMQVRPAHFT